MAKKKTENAETENLEINPDDTVQLTEAAEKIAVLEKENEAVKAQMTEVTAKNQTLWDRAQVLEGENQELSNHFASMRSKGYCEDEFKKLTTENEALKAQIKALETQLPKRMPKIDLAKTEASIRAQICI